MATQQNEFVAAGISTAQALAEEASRTFGDLTAQQLNWKPDPDRWSIAQCLDHLRTANAAYFPVFDDVLGGTRVATFWEKIPVLPGLWGKLLIKSVSPDSARKLKAPKVFQPSSSTISGDIVRRFVEQQARLITYLEATAGLELDKIIITSPAVRYVTYSLRDTYQIIFDHEKRHLNQAKRVLGAATD